MLERAQPGLGWRYVTIAGAASRRGKSRNYQTGLLSLVACNWRIAAPGAVEDGECLLHIGPCRALLEIAFRPQRRKLLGDRDIDQLVQGDPLALSKLTSLVEQGGLQRQSVASQDITGHIAGVADLSRAPI